MQDVVKKKTKAVENYRPSRHCRIGFKLKVSTIRLRRPWTRAFFRRASRTVGFSLRFKNSGHVMMFLRRCGLQNTDHVMPFWLFA